jgi:RND superfamily putative drug exporter
VNDLAPNQLLARLARLVVARRRLVLLLWVVLLLVGTMAAARITNRLSYNFAAPGQPAYVASSTILAHFGNGGQQAPAILVVSPVGPADEAKVARALAALTPSFPALRVVDEANAPGLDLLRHGTEAVYLFTPPPTSLAPSPLPDAFAHALAARLPGLHVALTGDSQLASAGTTSGLGVLAETVVAGVGALAVLVFVFGSLLAIVPLLVATVAILVTFLILLGLSYLTQVSFVVEFLVSLIGLGIAIDYSLLIVTRWREERGRGASNDEAITRAMTTAGRAVLLSGVTVAIGLVALIVLPVPLLRSTGIGGMLIPIISVTVVLTLLPALLAAVGRRLDWPHRPPRPDGSRAWRGIATWVTRHPWPSLLVAGALVVIFALPVLGIRLGQNQAASESANSPAAHAYRALVAHGYPAGILTPMEVLTRPQQAPRVVRALAGTPGIVAVGLPTGASGTRGGLSDVIAIPTTETVNSTAFAPVHAVLGLARRDKEILGVAGLGPNDLDFSRAIYGKTPLMLGIIGLITLVLLAYALRSLVLGIKAVVINLLSLGATFGILTWFWQEGHLSKPIFGIPATGAITFWIPISIFAFLYGLSMDYEVFILTRIREEYDRSRGTSEAIVNGLARTGRLVTSAAIILFLAFASLASAPLTDLRVLATGLGIGILVDATLIRGVLVPALIRLFGRANWWFPGRRHEELLPSD